MAKVTLTTPIGVARYPKISKPDTTGDYADNKYKTDVVFSDEETKALKAKILEFAKKELPDVKNPDLPIREAKDKETGEVTTFIRFKSARKPLIIDAKKNKIPDDVEVGGGSRIRVGGTLNAYKKGGNKGVNIYLNAVQVIELQQGFNINDFEEYEGEDAYVADAASAEATSEFDL
jgi:DNA-directed RNA polymerase subunit H (RpoH/RPB5)